MQASTSTFFAMQAITSAPTVTSLSNAAITHLRCSRNLKSKLFQDGNSILKFWLRLG
jgi:hypothetical protein